MGLSRKLITSIDVFLMKIIKAVMAGGNEDRIRANSLKAAISRERVSLVLAGVAKLPKNKLMPNKKIVIKIHLL